MNNLLLVSRTRVVRTSEQKGSTHKKTSQQHFTEALQTKGPNGSARLSDRKSRWNKYTYRMYYIVLLTIFDTATGILQVSPSAYRSPPPLLCPP